jgi:hypothetical protein
LSPVSGTPSTAQVDHQEPELKYQRPETRQPADPSPSATAAATSSIARIVVA